MFTTNEETTSKKYARIINERSWTSSRNALGTYFILDGVVQDLHDKYSDEALAGIVARNYL